MLPEVAALRLTVDEHHRHKDVYEHSLTVLEQAIALETGPDGPVPGPDLVLRLAALLHDIGKPSTRRFEDGGGVSFHHHEVVGAKLARKRLKELKLDTATTKDVARLVELHLRFHGYGGGEWTDSAVRRYVTDAGPLLERLHRLTRADCTTRNRRKAARLAATYDALEERIAVLLEAEELAAVRPDLDGQQIMALLGIRPGPLVGRAYAHLLELRMEHGPLDHGPRRGRAARLVGAAARVRRLRLTFPRPREGRSALERRPRVRGSRTGSWSRARPCRAPRRRRARAGRTSPQRPRRGRRRRSSRPGRCDGSA